MKITILNGNPEPSAFDGYLSDLESRLAETGHSLTRLDLRDSTAAPLCGLLRLLGEDTRPVCCTGRLTRYGPGHHQR